MIDLAFKIILPYVLNLIFNISQELFLTITVELSFFTFFPPESMKALNLMRNFYVSAMNIFRFLIFPSRLNDKVVVIVLIFLLASFSKASIFLNYGSCVLCVFLRVFRDLSRESVAELRVLSSA